jgi:hypothetical protein
MTDPAGFTVADLRSRAGEEAFGAAGEHVVAIDGPDEDEWSLSATVRLDDGRTLETILHHRAGGPLDGEATAPRHWPAASAPTWSWSAWLTLASTRLRRSRWPRRPRQPVIFVPGWPP